MKCYLSLCLLLTAIAFVGCQTLPYQPYARQVSKKPGVSGVIALKVEHQDEDRAKAQQMMASNCGGAQVRVLEEGEVIVGSSTDSKARQTRDEGESATKVGTLFGVPVMSGGREASNNTATNSTTTTLKEWNISYECKKAPSTAKK